MDLKKEFENLKTVSQVGQEQSYKMIKKFCKNYEKIWERPSTPEGRIFFENVLKVFSYNSFDTKIIFEFISDNKFLQNVRDEEVKKYFKNMTMPEKQGIIYYFAPLVVE